MMISSLVLLLSLSDVPGGALEARLRSQFEEAGRAIPESDDALNRAARTMALQALQEPLHTVVDSEFQTRALSQAQSADPEARAYVVRAANRHEAVQSLFLRHAFTEESATHLGTALVSDSARAVALVLLSERKASFTGWAFLRAMPGKSRLCVRLRSDLSQPHLVVTQPKGNIETHPMRTDDRKTASPGWCTSMAFREEGEYTLEVVATGARGPEVVALALSRVGRAMPPQPSPQPLEAENEGEARELILSRVNQLRAHHHADALVHDPALERIAQAYSERMATEQFFSHIAPDGSDLKSRLKKANYPFLTSAENLGLSRSPFAAHLGIERSPAHRKALLSRLHSHMGVGISTRTTGNRIEFIVVEVLASPKPGR